jgi:Tol biopolymer transport system component
MGEVYQAKDQKLGRDVAIKVLPEEFARDANRVARFQREAKLLASLNHPNIAAIYGLEESDGTKFLVLELVAGETLAERIKRGPIPVEEALKLALQIAEALEAAHEKGIIHRDLKPANIKVTPGGKVKVLDFGLAKAFAGEQAELNLADSPTLSAAATLQGVILGTAAYMSPEQARGKTVDKRADIWAFGVVLYEMLTGKHLFQGDTVSDTLASVLTRDPEWEKVPAKVRPLLGRCLEKDPKKRLRDIGDAYTLLESVPESAAVRRSWLAWVWAAIATLLVIAMAVPTYLYFRGREPVEAMRFDITVPPMPDAYNMAISPDGHWIAFTAFSSRSISSLFVREIGSVTSRQIEGTEGARSLFWSPDSRSIGFSAGGRLKRVSILGGHPRDICAMEINSKGGTWNSDGVIVFSDLPILRRVSAEGGESGAVTTLDQSRKDFGHLFPHFLPDGNHYLYVVYSSLGAKSDIYLGSLDSKKQTRLVTGASVAAYAEPGYLLFQRERTLFAQSFDANELTLSGEPVIISENLVVSSDWGLASFSTSQNGLLIYRSAAIQSGSQFSWFDRSGKNLGAVGDPGTYGPFDLSPDGRQIAVSRSDPATQSAGIWLIEGERSVTTRLTLDPAFHALPLWSPDGHRVAFSTVRKGSLDIYVKDTNGIGKETLLLESENDKWIKDWSKDGRYIAYGSTDGRLDALPLFGDRKPFPIVQFPASLNMPNFSYDGKWVAYNSDESGTWQIYAVSFPAANQKRQISTNGGVQPRWRRDGKELCYMALDGKIMAVDIKADAKIESGNPRMLFETGLMVDPTNAQYAVTADGQRFLLLKSLSETTPIPITVAVNWTRLLQK